MASHEHESGTTKQPIGLNRRTLIRTGAHVAWAVPAVAMVTPARAAAASNGLLVTATNDGWTGTTTPLARFAITFDLTNSGTSAATNLSVVFTLPAGVTIGNLAKPADWNWGGGGTNVITLRRNASLAGGASTGPLTVTFNPDDVFVGILIPVNITATADAPIAPGKTSTTIAAATPPVLTLSPQNTWSSGGGNRMVFMSRTIGNSSLPATSGLKVVLTLPIGIRDVTLAAASGNTTWNAVIDTSVATTGIVTFTPTAQLAGKAVFTFKPELTFATSVATRTGTVSILVSATNPGATDASGNYPKA